MRSLSRLLVLIGFVFAAVACQSADALPTAIPTAGLPVATNTAAASSLPPTRDIASTPTPLPPTPTATLRPTTTPTPVVAPILSLTTPAEGETLFIGQSVEVSGFVHGTPGMTVKVGLTSATGLSLATVDAAIDTNTWQATLNVPPFVSGAGTLQVVLLASDGSELARDSVPVVLGVDAEQEEVSYMALSRPATGDMVVAGHYLFFDGRLQAAGGGRVTIALLMDDCQNEVAGYTFSLRGSSYWQAYVIPPRDVSGPGCAVATVGSPGEEGWRAAQVAVEVLARNDPEAVGVMIANPVAGRRLTGGDTITVNGVAYNAPGGEVQVAVMLANGRIIGESAVEAGASGYWELEVTLPVDVEGEASITATLGDPDNPVAQASNVFTLSPGGNP
ncbi:MAG: hypothetical protein R3248_11110 [Candidatus Promineifilaceae bacterium]|nr:hypothetical protein [Candidatus Promineifilaceae bacterium]